MHKYILHLGSNLGDRRSYLRQAQMLIAIHIGYVSRVSNIYETLAWGLEDQDDFLNKALVVKSHHEPETVLSKIHSIENVLGRNRTQKWGPRTVDIDILDWDSKIMKKTHIKLPHPLISSRNFVMIPLQEVDPNWIHPITGESITELINKSQDKLPVSLYQNGE